MADNLFSIFLNRLFEDEEKLLWLKLYQKFLWWLDRDLKLFVEFFNLLWTPSLLQLLGVRFIEFCNDSPLNDILTNWRAFM